MLSQEEFLLPLLQELNGGPHVLLFGMLVEPVPEQHGVIAVHIAGISLKVYFSLIKVGFKCRYTVHKHCMQKICDVLELGIYEVGKNVGRTNTVNIKKITLLCRFFSS